MQCMRRPHARIRHQNQYAFRAGPDIDDIRLRKNSVACNYIKCIGARAAADNQKPILAGTSSVQSECWPSLILSNVK